MAITSQKSFTIDTFPYFYHVTVFHFSHSVFWMWHDTCVVWLNWSRWMSICFIFCFVHRSGNLILPWLLHLININTSFCWCDAFIIGLWMCFILRHVQFLRQYSPFPAPLTLSFAYVSTSLKVMWYGCVLIARFYYCCFLLQVQVHKSIQWYRKSGSCV